MDKPKNKLAGLDKTKSFKPKKKIQKGTRGYGLKQIAQMTIGTGNLQLAVELPAGEDLNEWLAVNTIEFYNEINVIAQVLSYDGETEPDVVAMIAASAVDSSVAGWLKNLRAAESMP